jgi:[methyl-Co(III) methanol-specific corrinoid protein]:coenzyme M methyltransferase
MPSAALPLDLCASAEALGASINYYKNSESQFPQPAKSLFASTKYFNAAFFQSEDFIHKGRLPLICDAMRLLKEDVGKEVVISAIIPGPYTLLLYLIEPGSLFAEMKRESQAVTDALVQLASFLAELGVAYREAGADFITIHDMGGSPGFIGPSRYEQFAYPAEKLLMEELPPPRVLSVCGNTNKSIAILAHADADAISVDQLNDLASSRQMLTDTLLFGNIDPIQTLLLGTPQDIEDRVKAALQAGVNAVWPGCDLTPRTPIENLKAFINAGER